MSNLMIPQPYYQGQGPGFNRIVRRQLTDAERQLGAGYYKKLQQGLRGIAVFSIVLYVVNAYMLPGLSDPITYDTLSMVLTVFMIVIGLAAVGMSIKTISIRKKISDVMSAGIGIEVTAPAYRSQGMQKVPSWTVGPISLTPTRELAGLIQEGAPTSVLCIPRLKIAIAINNYGLKHGAPMMSPPNLEAMAIPVEQAVVQPSAEPSWVTNRTYGPPSQQTPPQQTYSEEEPPPPPPDF